jgi:hypothetical protein
MFNEPTNHPLIPRKNNVIIEKRQVTVHTEDRDTRLKTDGTTMENQNKFSIQLPDHFENVSYVKLKNIQIPTYYINIAEKYKNNRVRITYPNPNPDPANLTYTVVIPDGFYTPNLLLSQLYILTFRKYDGIKVESFIDPLSSSVGKLLFASNIEGLANVTITINFSGLTYDDTPHCETINHELVNDFSNPQKNWGLGYILGFDKANDFTLKYDPDNIPNVGSPPNDIRLNYLKTIYLEVNDFNTISEKKPDTGNRNNTFGDGYYGAGGAALAKIPIPGIHDGIIPSFNGLSSQIPSENLETKKLFLNAFETRVHKLNFVFRDHRGRLIDFGGQDFTFTLEFGLVREVPERMLNILNFTE